MTTRTLIPKNIILLLAALLPISASAFPGLPPEYDLDGDGQTTAEEIASARAAEFKLIDADHNDLVSFAEFQTWREQKLNNRFAEADTDHNGALSQQEFIAGAPHRHGRDDNTSVRVFKLLDSDQDGVLSLAEFAQLKDKGHLIHHFARMDSDGDGQISSAEYLTPPKHSRRGDSSGDGRPAPFR